MRSAMAVLLGTACGLLSVAVAPWAYYGRFGIQLVDFPGWWAHAVPAAAMQLCVVWVAVARRRRPVTSAAPRPRPAASAAPTPRPAASAAEMAGSVAGQIAV